MQWVVWVLVALVLLTAAGWYLSFTAVRLDRLHARVDSSRAVLSARLAQRAATAGELATSGLLDPASALLLADAAAAAGDAPRPEREIAQSSLTEALAAVLSPEAVADVRAEESGSALLAELEAACARAEMARRFHNDAVAQTLRVRRKHVVRWARLAGHTQLPATVELDDAVPATLRGATVGVLGAGGSGVPRS